MTAVPGMRWLLRIFVVASLALPLRAAEAAPTLFRIFLTECDRYEGQRKKLSYVYDRRDFHR